jgi:DNA-binding NarL/FixJ family response regulator
MDKNAISIIIADPHELFREGLLRIMSEYEDLNCVAVASECQETIRLVSELTPDILLMDICMFGKCFDELVARANPSGAGTRIVVLTHSLTKKEITECFQAGVSGYLVKTIGREQLVNALRTVYNGEQVISPVVTRSIRDRLVGSNSENVDTLCPLKERELEVVGLGALGLTNKEIASELDIAEQTVASHFINIFGKLKVHSRTEAATRCLQHNWIILKEQPK